jgi:hypothetical protein
MTMLLVVLVVLLLLGVGGAPVWGYSHGYGWAPSGLITVLVIVLIVWLLLGHGVP